MTPVNQVKLTKNSGRTSRMKHGARSSVSKHTKVSLCIHDYDTNALKEFCG